MERGYLIAILCVSLLFLAGCTQQVVCNKPYIIVGTDCCLDTGDNGICDKDEVPTPNEKSKKEKPEKETSEESAEETPKLPVKEAPKESVGIACVDQCGNFACDEVVCMAEGCPCSENYRTCPSDCHEAKFEDLLTFARDSECIEKGELTENYAFNPETMTWWINMKMKPEFEKQGCAPACVIYEDEDKVELNWRCTSAIPE